MTPHDHVHFNLQSEHYPDTFQSITVEVDEVMNGTERSQTYFSALANKLNSGESFKPSSAFQADLTVIKKPIKGGKSKFTLRKRAIFDVLHAKQSVLSIRNTYEFCYARAICVTKAWLHKDETVDSWRKYDNMKRYEPFQARMARQLHE